VVPTAPQFPFRNRRMDKLLKCVQRRGLVVMHIENRVEPRYLKKVANVLVQVHQLQFAALVAQRGVVHHQLADARAVDMDYAVEVEQNLVVAVAQKLLHNVPQLASAFAQPQLAADVNDRDSIYHACTCLNRHVHSPKLRQDRRQRLSCRTRSLATCRSGFRCQPFCSVVGANANPGFRRGQSPCYPQRVKQRPIPKKPGVRWHWIILLGIFWASTVLAQKNDWLIVPTERVGPITSATTRSDLDTLFGKENVHDGNFEGGDVPEAATIVLADDPSAALAVTWDREHPSTVRVCFSNPGGPCKWKTASGIRMGLPIRELEKINGKSFQVASFGSDQRGKVISWRNGLLERDPSACAHLIVRLTPEFELEGRSPSRQESSDMKALQGEKPLSSNLIPFLELNPIVSALELQFSAAGCTAK
jgi:hypothetical protein